jgi:hypothetical protein
MTVAPDQTDEARNFLEAGHTFTLLMPDDAFRKLHREWKRFEKAEKTQSDIHEQVDGVINTATAAWHMADWVWRFYKPTIQKTYRIEKFQDFQAKLKAECIDLKICDIIANAAKHGGVAFKTGDRPELMSIIHAEDANGTLDARAKNDGGKLWSLELRVDDRVVDLSTSFSRVFMYWFDFLKRIRKNGG